MDRKADAKPFCRKVNRLRLMIVTRFAPSPTGYLHLGHAYAALMAAGAGTRFLLRIEDLDQGRAREEFVAAIFEDLHWLGLTWKEPVLRQSARMAAYRAALQALEKEGLTYPCFCSRKEIADEIARAVEAPHFNNSSAPPTGPDGALYPGTCRYLTTAEQQARIAAGESYALRLDAAAAARRAGALTFREKEQTIIAMPLLFGDLVLARKDVPAAYHLTRGEDLLPAAHVQRLLQALLALPQPHYAHHRLILDDAGRKFSKRDAAVTLRSLRETGATPSGIRARLGL
jgi:glutamyl-Q tRNA(Asp) synthetase